MRRTHHDSSDFYLRRIYRCSGVGGRWFLGFVLLCQLSVPRNAACAEIDASIVQRSIDRGITYLRKTQNERGSWDEYSGQSCGASALCTLAMLNAGVPNDDPAIIRAMRYLRTCTPNETYSVGLQTLVFCQLGAAGDIQAIRRNVDTLIRLQNTAASGDPLRMGGWGYGGARASSGDPSNSQFALLALGAAQDRGVEIDPVVFQRSLDYWQRLQRPGGGWTYLRQESTPSGSMTCAGIASLLIAKSGIQHGAASGDVEKLVCCGNDSSGEDPVDAALSWLGENLSVELNPGGQSFTYYYYMYALERVGRLTGRRFIGAHDWYREGAERLVAIQDQFEGFWAGSGWEEDRNVSTSFALLFLSKGKRQVVVGRLNHDNQLASRHHEALRQLVRHVEHDWRRDLTWQTIESDRASVEDLLQAPVLLISGRSALSLTAGQTDRLKEYIDQGGTILFEAEAGDGCGDASGFESSVAQLCGQWFPGSKLERLPPSHPVWFAEHRVDPNQLDRIGKNFWVYGIQACCRTAVFYVPNSLSCRWQFGGELFRRTGQASPVRQQVELSVQIGQNMIAYATGRELKDKLDERTVLRGSDLPESTRGVIQLAMLALDAGGLEAGRALPNVAQIISRSRPILIAAAAEPVDFDAEKLKFLPLLWIHGRTDFTLDENQRKVLRGFVENGGIIFGTAICGSQPFADAFRREISTILAGASLQRLPLTHPALTPAFGGFDVSSVDIRKPTETAQGIEISRYRAAPEIEVAIHNGFSGVFFSPLDVSCALESQNSVQCHGYDTSDAAKIVANVLLYAVQQ